MCFSKPVSEIIRERTSWRQYADEPLNVEDRTRLAVFLAGNSRAPFESRVRFELIAATQEDQDALKGLGTYGFIRNAPAFIAGATRDSLHSLEVFGYLMEKSILYATDLGLGTCWLGGTFNKSNFATKISAQEGELVAAVAAVGYRTSERGRFDAMTRWVAGSRNRKPWDAMFFSGAFGVPLSVAEAGPYGDVLESVRLGPSASNKQPWRVVKQTDSNIFHLILERTPGYQRNFDWATNADLQRLDMGIAMCHFELVARERGLEGSWPALQPPALDLPAMTQHIATWVG